MGVASNARWVAVAQIAKIASQFIGTALLARLLDRADYGLMAMALVATTFATLFRDMGTSTAIIQRPQMQASTLNTVFWFNMALGLLIAASLFLLSGAVGALLRAPGLPPVLHALCLTFPFSGAGATHQALLERESKFKQVAGIEIVSSLVGLGAAVIAAVFGAGVYSLVLQTLTSAALSTILFWHASPYRPTVMFRLADLRSILGFSGYLALFNFVNYFARNADSALIGRVLGAAELGTYTIAYRLMLFPLQNITFVAARALLPVMSRLSAERGSLAPLFMRTLRAIASITAPAMLALLVLRHEVVEVLFGSKWSAAADVVAWLAPTGLLQSVVSSTGSVYAALGRTKLLFYLGTSFSILLIAGFVVGVNDGVERVAQFYFFMNLITAPLNLHIAARQVDGNLADVLRAVGPAIIAAAVMALAMLALAAIPQYASQHAAVRLLCGAVLGGAVYGALLWGTMKDSLSDIKRLIRPGGGVAVPDGEVR